MARPRKGSSQSLLNQANRTIDDLLNDPETPVEVRARLAVKVCEWSREDLKQAAQVIELTAAREAELRQQGIDEWMASTAASMQAALERESLPNEAISPD